MLDNFLQLRQAWSEEAKEKLKIEEEELERLKLVAAEKEKKRLEAVELVRQEKAKKLNEKRQKFVAKKSLIMARLAGSTWMKKDGEAVYYDAVNWKEQVNSAREQVKDLIGEKDGEASLESVAAPGEEEDKEVQEAVDEGGEETSDAAMPSSKTRDGASEWIEVEVDGRKVQMNVVTNEYK